MKKVLLFFPHPLAKRHGGPYSALYHLQHGLQAQQHSIHFLSDVISFENSPPLKQKKRNVIRQSIKKLIPKTWRYRLQISTWFKELETSVDRRVENVNLDQYAALHFHETIDIWRYRHLLKTYTGQVVLTSHSPKPYHRELLEDVLNIRVDQVPRPLLRQLQAIDSYAYRRADYCIFPNIEASEPYYQLWEEFSALVPQAEIISIPTGVMPPDTLMNPDTIRKNLGIPEGAFVVTFVGRQSAVKGFDLLTELARQVLNQLSDVYFLIVGKKEYDGGFTHNRWIETGWINDPLSYIGAGNLHVVPNRFANFDLNILEALSIGKPVLLSETGGNKYLNQFGSEGIFFHPLNPEGFLFAFAKCYAMRNNLQALGAANRTIYENNFTADTFAQRHIAFYKKILA